MSTLVVNGLKRSTEAVARTLRGVAAAWVNFNGTGTVAIRDSENTSSITDNGTGSFSLNFTSAMADAFYCPGGFCNFTSTSPAGIVTATSAFAPTTAACPFFSADGAVGSAIDTSHVNLSVMGDLA